MSSLQENDKVADLLYCKDWHGTSIGPPETWPQSLRTALSIVFNSRFPMVLFWGPDLVCFYNDAFRPSLGQPGKHPWAFGRRGEEMWAEIWGTIKPWLDQVLSGGESIWMENQLVGFYRNGRMEDIYWTFCYSAVQDETGGIAGVFVTCTETTDAVLSARRLKESELFARNIIMNSEAAHAVWTGPDMIFEMANGKMLEMLGRDEGILGKSLLDAVPELEQSGLLNRLHHVLQSGETYYQPEEIFVFNRYGKPHTGYYNCSFKALQNAEGRAYAILCTAIDVTEQVLARKKLEDSEQAFRNLVIKAPVGLCIVAGTNMVVEVVNDLFLKLVGRRREEFESKGYWDVLYEAKAVYEPILQAVFNTGKTYTASEHQIPLIRNGSEEIVYVSFVYEPLKDDDGTISRVLILAIDVTAQVLARRKIEEAEERARLAIDVSQLGLFEVDLQSKTIIASPRLNEIFDISSSTNQDRFIGAIHPDDLAAREEAYQQAFRTGVLQYEGRILRKDGTVRWVRSRGKIFFDKGSQPVRLIGVSQDITEQKEFEEELNKQVKEHTSELVNKNAELERTNQKLEEFAHAASHDLKEPVRKIHFFTDRLKNQLKQATEEQRNTLERIEASARRMTLLIDDLLQYSYVSQPMLKKEAVDLNKKIALVLEDLELDVHQKKAIVEVHPMPTVMGYRRQLQQLFQNLISNALKYSKAGVPPHIVISATKKTCDEVRDLFTECLTGDDFHLITVSDNGIGFEQEDAERIFQMFQRLHGKTEYSGTGIGLAIVRKVVENHGGKIIASGRPGEGATFKIYLPVRELTD